MIGVSPETFQYQIYQDWGGLYRWDFRSPDGSRLAAGRYGHAAHAGAYRDAQHDRHRRGLSDDVEIKHAAR
jgi:hypothetical protein